MLSPFDAQPRFRISVHAASARYRITIQELKNAIRTHRLSAIRAGRLLYVRQADLDVYLASRATARRLSA